MTPIWSETPLEFAAPSPVRGSYARGFAEVAHTFAAHFREQREIGAGLTVYQRGQCVVDLWGGYADTDMRSRFERDTRVVVFSVTKGLAAMALHLLADRGLLDWDAPVATYWPGFAKAGKGAITVRTLVNHRAGLAALDTPVTMADCVVPQRYPFLVRALESQKPLWTPGEGQGYHAVTFGMYVRELFERIASSLRRFTLTCRSGLHLRSTHASLRSIRPRHAPASRTCSWLHSKEAPRRRASPVTSSSPAPSHGARS